MNIEYLKDCKDYVGIVNDWLFNQWGGHYSNSKKDEWLAELKTRLNKRQVPTTFVASKNDKPIGTASLIKHDLEIRNCYTPWLADVYVHPQYRKQGVGSKLVTRVVEEATTIGKEKLYLFTRAERDFYLHLGWEVIETTTYQGTKIDIMAVDLR